MGIDEKVRDACHRIEELYYETDGRCYISFSGGKDSTAVLALVKMCEEIWTIQENSIPAVFSNTGIELGVTVDFVKWVKENYYTNVVMIRPEVSFDWVLRNKGKPMLSKQKSHGLRQFQKGKRTEALRGLLFRGETQNGHPSFRNKIADKDMHVLSEKFGINVSDSCCTYMKKKPLENWEKENKMRGALLGIRMQEGGVRLDETKRRIMRGGKICTVMQKGRIKKYPIIDWYDEDIDEFIEKYNVPLSDAYTKFSFRRTGCMACPYARSVDKDLMYLFINEPSRYKAAMHWLKDVYIAQNVALPFDEAYERERERMWREQYEPMRQEMLRMYRPNSKLIKESEQLSLFDEEVNDIKRERNKDE